MSILPTHTVLGKKDLMKISMDFCESSIPRGVISLGLVQKHFCGTLR